MFLALTFCLRVGRLLQDIPDGSPCLGVLLELEASTVSDPDRVAGLVEEAYFGQSLLGLFLLHVGQPIVHVEHIEHNKLYFAKHERTTSPFPSKKLRTVLSRSTTERAIPPQGLAKSPGSREGGHDNES